MPDANKVDAASETGGETPKPDADAQAEVQAADKPASVETKATKSEEADETAKRLDNRGREIDVGARDVYARWTFYTIACWLVFIAVVVLLQGFLGDNGLSYNWAVCAIHYQGSFHFHLSDAIILALIGGTTLTVTGLFVIILNYFFAKSK